MIDKTQQMGSAPLSLFNSSTVFGSFFDSNREVRLSGTKLF
jgi:hypothetical protein